MFGLFEPGHIIVLFVLVLVLFGPNRLPELARGLGKAVREMRKLASEFQLQLDSYVSEEKPRPKPAPYEPPKPAESVESQPAPVAEPHTYAPAHPPVPEYGTETATIEKPVEVQAAANPERIPLPPQVIDNGQTIPRQKTTPQPEA